MEELTLQSKILFCQFDELADEDKKLVTKAIDATERSYAHYSNFRVGACVRLANGVEIIGANQENAVYPVGLCAERTAIFAAQVQYPEQPIDAIAIAARNEKGQLLSDPVTPCGSCRQVMVEMEGRYNHSMRILLYGERGIYVIDSIKSLMPLSFAEDSMK
jgi:cytidine deaminase (EC 3.5.4.5)